MNTSYLAAQTGLDAIKALCNSGTLVFYNAAMPASPETAVAGTALVTWDFAATAFAADSGTGNDSAVAAFTNNPVSPAAAGTAVYARAFISATAATNPSAAIADFTIVAPWVASTAVVLGQLVTANGNTYKYTTAGTTGTTAPSGTATTATTDGTAAYEYVGAGTLGDISLGASGIQTGVTVNLSNFTLTLPGV
jgi:hypothetical protein